MFEKLMDKLGKNQKLKKILTNLGENNDPTYAAIAIAAAKGIFRPTFTMMDKNEDPKTKKYTALREGLTEVIAIPAYFVSGKIADKIAEKVQKDTSKMNITKANLRFLAVCTTLLVIPGLCSCIVKPFTSRMFKDSDSKKTDDSNNHLDVVEGNDDVVKFENPMKNGNSSLNPVRTNYSTNVFTNNGMRV